MDLLYKSFIAVFLMMISTVTFAGIHQYGNVYAVNVDWDAGPFELFDGIYLHANIYAVNVKLKAGSEFVSTGMISARNVEISARNIRNAQDPNLGMVCWTNFFILNGLPQSYHDPKCNE